MIKVAISGCNGAMGRALTEVISNIKNTSNDVSVEVIKDGREVTYRNPYCTFSEIFLLEDLAIEELTNRGINPVTFERMENIP